MSLGKKIKSLRKAKGMTQKDLSDAVGYVNRSTIANIESGNADPACDMIPKFANALGVPISVLLEEDPNERKVNEMYRILGCLMRCDNETIKIVKKIIHYHEH